METFTINDCECIDVFIKLPDFEDLPLNAIASGYFEARFLDLLIEVQFAGEEVSFNAVHDGE